MWPVLLIVGVVCLLIAAPGDVPLRESRRRERRLRWLLFAFGAVNVIAATVLKSL